MQKAKGWCTEQVSDLEIHVYPIDDLVSHDVAEGDENTCVCGTSVECLPQPDEPDVWMFTHHALDGRE